MSYAAAQMHRAAGAARTWEALQARPMILPPIPPPRYPRYCNTCWSVPFGLLFRHWITRARCRLRLRTHVA